MKFIVDTQLPRRIARELMAAGHDAVHVLNPPHANRMSDSEIVALAASENSVLATRDADFVASFLLHAAPSKLLLISAGNMSNDAISHLVSSNLFALQEALTENNFIELTTSSVMIRG